MSGGRVNRAVMEHRGRSGGLDDFPTPPWAGRALCEHLIHHGFDLAGCAVREPAAGRGTLARGLADYFALPADLACAVWGAELDDWPELRDLEDWPEDA